MKKSFKRPKFHTFNGKRYKIEWKKPRGAEGICYAPSSPANERKIHINPNLPTIKKFEVALHEALHAELWDLDEDAVTRISENITDFLQKLDLTPN